jgi:hypothetical protein
VSPALTPDTETHARTLLVRYLTGKTRVSQLLKWFGRVSWELEESGQIPTMGLLELLNEVGLSLDEYTSGHRSSAELKRLLREALSSYWLSVEMTVPTGQARFGSESRSNALEFAVP